VSEHLKIALFMRVSTKKQTAGGRKVTRYGKEARPSQANKEDESIPLQRQILTEYVASKKVDGWMLSGIEYVEAGVSAFHTHSSKRKELIRAFEDAKQGAYDILLLYKLDRFGRRSSESLDLALKFLRYCRIWVYDKKSEFTNTNDADEIKNFIEFWSAKKASIDTKQRVSDAMLQIHKEGYWTGGEPPFGYSVHPTKTGVLEMISEEVEIVKDIYHRYVVSGWGMIKIAKYLNDKGILTRRGNRWRNDGMMSILRNSIYKGFLSYGKTKTVSTEFGKYQQRQKEYMVSDKHIPEYQMITTEIWDKAQEKREERRKAYFDPEKQRTHNGRGKALLTGVLFCECGGGMVRDSKKYNTKSGDRVVKKYRCIHSRKGSPCHAIQKSYKADQLEDAVLSKIEKEIDSMIESDTLLEIQKQVNQQMETTQVELKQAKEDVERMQKTIHKLDDILLKLLMGEETNYSEEQIKRIYEKSKKDLQQKQAYYHELASLESVNALNKTDTEKLQDAILLWRELFNVASEEEKRTFIYSVIESIHLKGNEIKLVYRFDVTKFVTFASATKEGVEMSYVDSGGSHTVSKTLCAFDFDIRRLTKTFPKPLKKWLHFRR
jgi:site-specific DNA recombinase